MRPRSIGTDSADQLTKTVDVDWIDGQRLVRVLLLVAEDLISHLQRIEQVFEYQLSFDASTSS